MDSVLRMSADGQGDICLKTLSLVMLACDITCPYFLGRGLGFPLPSECLFLACLFFEQPLVLVCSAPPVAVAAAAVSVPVIVGTITVVFQ